MVYLFHMEKLPIHLSKISLITGRLISYLTILMVIGTLGIVILRYAFDMGWIFIQEIIVGGEAIQTFQIRAAAVDSETTQPEATIATIINKYEENNEGKDQNVDGHYNLKDPLLAAAVDGYLNKKVQNIKVS